jgi:hypothetical protein
MTGMGRHEYLRAIYERYRRSSPAKKGLILDEFRRVCGYHRKYAIRRLNGPRPGLLPRLRRARGPSSGRATIQARAEIWEAAGYPWSVRLKAMLPVWLPWLRRRRDVSAEVERALLAISPRQIDRRLVTRKHVLRRRIYGRTKPGTLLKHHVPIKTDHWNVTRPGFTEIDLVSHSGNCAEGEFAHSFNLADIHSTWTATRAVLGKGQSGIVERLEALRRGLPFRLRGIDSDNGSEFLNHHLVRYCQAQQIQFTRGRPYKKDDNAHIEQKNWTHVRRLVGWDRYDSTAAVAALNDLYRHEWCWMMNLFQPSVKLVRKERVGARMRRVDDAPQTPLDRLRAGTEYDSAKVAELLQLREPTDPFELARTIGRKMEHIAALARPTGSAGRVTSQTA